MGHVARAALKRLALGPNMAAGPQLVVALGLEKRHGHGLCGRARLFGPADSRELDG